MTDSTGDTSPPEPSSPEPASPHERPEPRYGQYASSSVPRYGEVAPDRPPAYPDQTPPPFRQAPVPQPPAKAPRSVTAAFVLWIVAAVLVVLAAWQVLQSPETEALVRETLQGSGISDAEITASMPAAKSFALTLFGIAALVGILLAYFMWRGRNWARIVLSVFGVVRLIGSLSSLTVVASGGAALSLFDIATMLTIAAALVCMYLRPSSAYFRARIARRSTP